jgi:ElaB/YqjD/DUF883 family membrane-anchored ribosome-binding protein
MAVSEGQLTLEFMQALTAEAQAHRAYLQLLYAVTLGVVGGGLVILAGVFVWLGQRSLTQMKENLNAAFDARIGSLFEERSKEADEKFAEIKQTIDSLRQFRSTAEREMDVIASIASEAKAATRVDVEDNFPKNSVAMLFVSNNKQWVFDIVKGEFGSFFNSENYQSPDDNFIDIGKPRLIVLDLDTVNTTDLIEIRNQWLTKFGPIPIIVVDERVRLETHLKILSTLIHYDELYFVSGPSEFLSAARKFSTLSL